MGINTPLSTNAAMTLGGLEQGVTPLELAYAYSTIANRGQRKSGTMAASEMGPVAIESVKDRGSRKRRNRRREERVPSRARRVSRRASCCAACSSPAPA